MHTAPLDYNNTKTIFVIFRPYERSNHKT